MRTSARRALLRILAHGVLFLPVCATPGAAQTGVAAFPVRGLRFGVLTPGSPTTVSPADAGGRVEIEVVGAGQVTLSFTLPAALVSERERRVPLRFGASDGRVEFARGNRSIAFDPRQLLSLKIPPGQGGVSVYLGGTALPSPSQPPGAYTATIVLQIATPGT